MVIPALLTAQHSNRLPTQLEVSQNVMLYLTSVTSHYATITKSVKGFVFVFFFVDEKLGITYFPFNVVSPYFAIFLNAFFSSTWQEVYFLTPFSANNKNNKKKLFLFIFCLLY